jgi:hypothetical protein
MTATPMSRRNFLAAGGAALTAGLVLNNRAFGANDRLSIGVIGTGDRAGFADGRPGQTAGQPQRGHYSGLRCVAAQP